MDELNKNEAPVPQAVPLTRRQVLQGIAASAAALAAGQILAACSPSPTNAPAPTTAPAVIKGPKAGGKAVWAINSDPSCIAPFGILLGVAHDGKELLYDSLVQWDRNLKVLPALAESWSTPDDKTYVFKLKQGLKFHNGQEVTADDVKYSVELMSGTKLPPPGAAVSQYPSIVSVDAVDKYTAKFNMKGPDATVIGFL